MANPLEKIHDKYSPKEPSGLRSLVRQGKLGVEEAFSKLNKMAKESGCRSPEMVSWLKRRSKRG